MALGLVVVRRTNLARKSRHRREISDHQIVRWILFQIRAVPQFLKCSLEPSSESVYPFHWPQRLFLTTARLGGTESS
jgi:hypothetical protein